MSEKTKSFFGTIPGVVTGLAGLLTAVVGLITLLVQLDVIGGDDDQTVGTTGTTVAGATPTAATEDGSFTVSPTSLTFAPTDPSKEKTVAVKNTGTASLTVQAPKVTGKDAQQFTVATGDCTGPLAPNLSCNLRVTFTPGGPLRNYDAKLQIEATGSKRGEEVKVTASTLL